MDLEEVAEVRMVSVEDGQGFGCCVCVDSVLMRRLHVAHRPQRMLRCCMVFSYGIVRTRASVEKCTFVSVSRARPDVCLCVYLFLTLMFFDVL